MNDAQQPQETSNVTGLGSLLRQAREAAGLSQVELARHLNLGAGIVEALEQEDLQALPGAVYVQGYLRKWVEYLKLDEQQLQQAYNRLSGNLRKNELSHTKPIEPMRIKKPASSFPWFKLLLFIGIIVAGLFATRFLPESMRFIDTSPEISTRISASNPVSAPILPSIPLIPPQPESAAVAPTIATPPLGIVVGETLTTPLPPITTPSESSPITTPPTPAPQGLELQGLGNAQGSWVRVKDADARIIFEGTLTPGNSKQLDGKRPFEITIGRASDLKVMLDGANIDLKAYARSAGKAFIPKLGNASSQ